MMSHQRLSIPPTPRTLIQIVKQTSPFEERVTKNGIQRDIHVVIKNSPFIVQIGVVKNCEIDLNHVAFEATLLYDTEGDKGVDFVKIKPVEYKCVPSEAGDQVAIELRIKVLTSQHEDMFFKVSIQGHDPVSKQEIPNLLVITSPIKVISKPEQLKKRQPAPTNPSTASTMSKKRTVNDMVVEAITRIEKQQAEQTYLMEKLLEMQHNNNKRPHSEISGWDFAVARAQTKEIPDFDSSFLQLLKTFAAIEPNQRAEKVRHISRGLSAADHENFSELVDMLTSEGLGQDPGHAARPAIFNAPLSLFDNKNYGCNQCTHKHELEKIDNIFFTMPPYGANTGVLHQGGLSSSLDPESYPDFLSHSPPPEFLSM